MFSEQMTKRFQLPPDFHVHGLSIVRRDDLVFRLPLSVSANPFREINVQPDTEPEMSSSVVRRRPGSGPAHHQAGAGQDSRLMRADDSAIDAIAQPEVVGIDDDAP